jgi:hypothetical protein
MRIDNSNGHDVRNIPRPKQPFGTATGVTGLDGAFADLIRGASKPTISRLSVVMHPQHCHAKRPEQGRFGGQDGQIGQIGFGHNQLILSSLY